ncbi:hypothetical protein TVAG_030880 [Trichomonas vaginalis G3]|uniref:GP63-like n=1 Tax=Trichomonas vaginalis (strain ATCC PRA-98 / G3) TaxID=412133 RepID=A2EYJ6_TRIV3|nr:regulation of choline O-acetyltransferase protein [Trichomonas vaginalis G3]EAY02272.1 hypothetical protein TVAG_030880 [Trichomonas vaginalis G3]KAI5522900.1 regulation of choline O-acetyltransferase protein [Trichomonas vaginalis G3]|eukprot:XP_001314589.1 hypothetical protein [Trichomonas vaginalis G3]
MFLSLFFSSKSQEEAFFNEKCQWIFPEPEMVPEYTNIHRQTLDDEWKNIRIKLNMSYVTGELREQYSCYDEGQIIDYYGHEIKCDKKSTLPNTDLTNFTKTLNHFKEFQESFLKVLPSPNKDYDMELIIKIVRYPPRFGLPVKSSRDKYNEYLRTTQATLIIDYDSLPTEPSIWDTDSSYFVGEMMHGFFNTLNIISGRYHPKNSTELYPVNETYCSLTKYGRQYNFLIGPYSHLFAQKHYGVNIFEGDNKTCPPGIEIEYDGSRSLYSNNYVMGRLFYTDIAIENNLRVDHNSMVRITDVTIALLQDTGNYICNWSMARPIVWGNPETQIDGKPIKDFALGPPQIVFPKQYYYYPTRGNMEWDKESPDYVGFDFKHGGYTICDKAPICGSSKTAYCKGIDFYNPLNKFYVGFYSDHDYLPIKYLSMMCKDGETMIPGDSVCHQYICNKYDNFTLITPDYGDIDANFTNITCTKENANLNFTIKLPGYFDLFKNITCIDPELFCRTVKLQEMHFVRDPFDPDLSVTQLNDPYAESQSARLTRVISQYTVVGITVIVVIVIIVFIVIFKYRSSHGDQEEFDNVETADHGRKSKQEEIEEDQDANSGDNYLSD